MEETLNGVLGSFEDNIDQRDYFIGADEIPKLELQDSIRYTRNQYLNPWSSQDCTIVSNFCAACSVINYEPKLEDFKTLHDTSI